MRHIDIFQIELPDGWEEKAKKLTEEISQISDPEERSKFINKNKIWSELKKALEKLSNNKCWYSEAKAKLSVYDVDHFRPKGKIKNYDGTIDNVDGYWWLTYDWKNYRLSGQICNRPNKDIFDGKTKGKHNYFPLKKGSAVAKNPGDDISAEVGYLLDPIDEDDPCYLTFDNTGEVFPAVTNDTWEYERAKITIELLNLNFDRLKDARRETWEYCERLINEASYAMIESKGQTSVHLLSKMKETKKRLKELIDKDSELSSVASACLLNSSYTWVRNLVLN